MSKFTSSMDCVWIPEPHVNTLLLNFFQFFGFLETHISSCNCSFPSGLITSVYFVCTVQRPRRVGAKFTGDDIKPDEHLQPQLSFDFDGKRDR